jgi:hypothetical protein
MTLPSITPYQEQGNNRAAPSCHPDEWFSYRVQDISLAASKQKKRPAVHDVLPSQFNLYAYSSCKVSYELADKGQSFDKVCDLIMPIFEI